MKQLANQTLIQNGLKLWQVAERLNINEEFSRRLRNVHEEKHRGEYLTLSQKLKQKSESNV
jgi:hypothetical protein